MIYLTAPDNVWALDARTGREMWHHTWQSTGGIHIGNRGAAVLGESLFFETPDCHLVSLNIKDGSERWRKQICDLDQFYYGSVAPVVVKNHVIAGVSGDDLDVPGYVQAHDPEHGRDAVAVVRRCRRRRAIPGRRPGRTKKPTKHGGGMTWQPVTYDPELNLIFVTTGNPQPVIAHSNRAGDNLFTASIVALNPDTGKMAWYFQSSPHDTHDWDSTQTPVLFEGEINGQPRKLLAQAARNGHFFVLDRATGKALVSIRVREDELVVRIRREGPADSEPAKHPQVDGALVSPDQGGATNWPPPSFSPQTGLVLRQRCALPTASTTCTTRPRTRRGGAAPTAAGGRSR